MPWAPAVAPGAPCLRSEWHEGGGRGYRSPRKRSALSLLRGRQDNSPGARTSAEPELPSAAEQHFRLTSAHCALGPLPSVPPDTKLSKLDVLLLATTYIAHLTRSLQDDAEAPADPGLGALRGDGYLHPVKKWPMRSRLYIGATGQFLKHSVSGEKANDGNMPADSQP
ncbi:PREDICTED: transcription factor 24 [Myotis davidii]|uniref:transcription factor 24 n=1 Tax=Myotis davidii TaxID=225400 RepID=UPI0003EC100E|nr:PREDICTED: transcription factor 24 [Myotis davidii]